MAEPLAIDLSPPGPVTGSGSGAPVDIAPRRSVVLLDLRVREFVGDGRLLLILETSEDGLIWRQVTDETVSQGFGERRLGAHSLGRQVRLRWEAQGTVSVLLSATGEAHVVYCSPRELNVFGLPPLAVDRASDADLVEQCVAATDEADGYLGAAYTLPLLGWGRDLRLHCAKMSTRYILDCIGWQPEGPEDVVEKGFDRAITWLNRIANGRLSPPEIVDSTPESNEGGSVVVSRPRRGW